MPAPEALIDPIIDGLIAREGREYTNHPADRGGPTKFGITLATLTRARGGLPLAAEDVAALTEDEARRIYYDLYVVRPGFVHILALCPRLGAKLVDAGVNCGPERAARWLQRALNSFNRSYKTPPDYPELVVDGAIGIKTIDALSRLCISRGRELAERVVIRAVNCQQGDHYLDLGAKDEQQEAFMLGWFDKRVQ